MSPLGYREIDANTATIHFYSGAAVLSRAGIAEFLKVNETKAPGTLCLCINHHLDAFDGSVLVEQLAYLVLRGICVQSKDSYAAACLWMFARLVHSFAIA